jgi:hypothetical protein
VIVRSPKITPTSRLAPPEVIQIEESSDPKRRARLRAVSRLPIASERLRRHLSLIAELQKYRVAPATASDIELPTIAIRPMATA